MNSPQFEWFSKQILWLPHNPVLGTREVVDVTPPEREYSLKHWQEEVGKNFPEYVKAAEICVSVVTQLLIQDVRNPFPLILVDRAGSGKTIILNFFCDIEGITFMLDQFTPHSFVSHIAGRTAKQLEKIDLLPMIRLKTLVVGEMGTVFGENDDQLRQKIGLLTRVFDGEGYRDWSGVHGQRGYKGDYNFMFLGASTPFPLRVWKLMTQFGHRFQFLSLGTKRKGVADLILQRTGEGYKVKEKKCREATDLLLRTLWTKFKDGIAWDKQRDDPKAIEWIARLSVFLSGFRGDIIAFEEWTESGKEISTNSPCLEDPSRLFACFCNLAQGHAVADERNYITMDDIEPVMRVAISSAPTPRPELWKALLRAARAISLKEVMEILQVSEKTARKEMHKFLKVGVCIGEVAQDEKEADNGQIISYGQKKSFIDIHPEFSWWRDEETVGLLEKFGIID